MATLISPSGGASTPATPLATTAPLTDVTAAAVGTSTEAARADHRHAFGGVFHHTFVTGGYYGVYNTGLANVAQATGILQAMPMFVPTTQTFDRILVNVTTAGVGPIRLGVYNNGSDYPTTLLLSAGTIDSALAGQQLITITQELTPGIYWLAALTETTTNASLTSSSGQSLGIRFLAGGTPKGYRATVAAGALPATFPTVTAPATESLIRVLLRAA